MALSDTTTIRQARASDTDYTLKDADGLAHFVTATSTSWRDPGHPSRTILTCA
jgi:hypothetical protein